VRRGASPRGTGRNGVEGAPDRGGIAGLVPAGVAGLSGPPVRGGSGRCGCTAPDVWRAGTPMGFWPAEGTPAAGRPVGVGGVPGRAAGAETGPRTRPGL